MRSCCWIVRVDINMIILQCINLHIIGNLNNIIHHQAFMVHLPLQQNCTNNKVRGIWYIKISRFSGNSRVIFVWQYRPSSLSPRASSRCSPKAASRHRTMNWALTTRSSTVHTYHRIGHHSNPLGINMCTFLDLMFHIHSLLCTLKGEILKKV